MQLEYNTLVKNPTWDLVSSSKASHVVQNKCVFRVKLKVDESLDKYKARLVAKGFQQAPGVDYFETFSPVVKASTIRFIFTLDVTRGWDIQQIDINNAFLNGDLQEEFMTNLKGLLTP